MSISTSFIKLSSSEAVLDEWEVLDDPAHLTSGDIAKLAFSGLVVLLGLICVWQSQKFATYYFYDFDSYADSPEGSPTSDSPEVSPPSVFMSLSRFVFKLLLIVPGVWIIRKFCDEDQLPLWQRFAAAAVGTLLFVPGLSAIWNKAVMYFELGPQFGILFVIGWALLVFGALAILAVLIRPRRDGYLCLTNWRCIYCERGTARWRNSHFVAACDLADVIAVETVYEETWLGAKTLFVQLRTRYEDGIRIRIGDTSGLLARLPIVGALFRHRTIGKDAFRVGPTLFNLIQERQASAVESRSSF